MGVKVATSCFRLSQHSLPHSPPSPQAVVSTVSSPSLRRRSSGDGALFFRSIQRLDRPVLFGTKLCKSRSLDRPESRGPSIRRTCSASLDAFSDEEFSRKIRELAMRFQSSEDDGDDEDGENTEESETVANSSDSKFNSAENQRRFDPVEPPDWAAAADELVPASIEWKAKSVDLPLSLRIIKRKKKQWREGFIEAGESAYCSVKKAFSSMVFIIQELHSFTLQMREKLLYEDLQGILDRVQREMHASFVWLFQQVFSHTPTLMVYVMILLANYGVYSMTAAAAPLPPQPYAAATESVSVLEDRGRKQQKFDSKAVKRFSASSTGGRTASIGGNNGGSGKFRPVPSGTDGDGRFDGSAALNFHKPLLPDGVTSGGNSEAVREEESVLGEAAREDELRLWSSMVEEAARMQAASRDASLDHETMQGFVSPVTAKIEADDYADYFRTELLYQTGLGQDPDNPLLLGNYAQFLCLVARDYDRAEEYFKRAVKAEPPDPEAMSKYASFLWLVRKDLWAAEETYLEAISADPSNSYYAANYAHFLWSTGGEDTCFPIDNSTTNQD